MAGTSRVRIWPFRARSTPPARATVAARGGGEDLRLSARNKLEGTITRITVDGGSAQIELAVGENRIVASITAEAVEELGLEEGATAWAVIKASDVMIGAPH